MKWIIASMLFIAVSALEMTQYDRENGVKLILHNRDPNFVNGQLITDLNAVEAMLKSKPMKIVVHGYYSKAEKWKKKGLDITENFLKMEDCNVILVDWSTLATGAHANQPPNSKAGLKKHAGYYTYLPASRFAMDVGDVLADVLLWIRPYDLHLIGHSLGAQAVGRAGRVLSDPRRFGFADAPLAPRRVTGLDPAGPRFELDNRKQWGVDAALQMIGKDSGQFVDIIHTNAGVLGAKTALGDVDFYVNGGRRWQICAGKRNVVPIVRDYLSHSHSKRIFIESILNKEDQKYLSPVCLNFNTRFDTNLGPICWGADTRYSNWVGYGARAIRQGSQNEHIVLLTEEKVTTPCPVDDAEIKDAVWMGMYAY